MNRSVQTLSSLCRQNKYGGPELTEKEVIYEIREGIAYITLNRPEKLNAINPEMRELLWDAFQDVQEQ